MTTSELAVRLRRNAESAARVAVTAEAAHLGVDLVEIAQLERQLHVAGHRLATRIFTPSERRFCQDAPDRLATTLAGKEAVAKVLGTGFRGGVRWQDIEILREDDGRPTVHLSGAAWKRAEGLGLDHILISLTHEGPFAMAVASGVRGEFRT